MMLKRETAFGYFAVSVFMVSIIYILAGGINGLGEGQEYPYLQGGMFLVWILGLWLCINGGTAMAARIDRERRLRRAVYLRYGECVLVIVVLAAATILRIMVIQRMPMEAESDYRTYYEVAKLILAGKLATEGPGYCDYIAMFPHVYGYPYVLAIVFRVFGTGVETAQYFNVFLSVATVFLSYWTGRTAGGRICGLAVLLFTAFWPSQIIYINMVASEYLFSCLLMVCIYLFVLIVKTCSGQMKYPVWGVALHIILGICLAFTAAVRPMALLLLITIVLCICFDNMRLPARLAKDQPISLVFLSRGWMRCLLILAVYIGINRLIAIGITNEVDRDLASGSTSFGYNLLVGLNVPSCGGWNQEDSEYLYEAMERTGNASEAHMACRDLAVERLKDTKGILNLFFQKFQILWMNDDYGTTWNLLFMDQQGTLTQERRDILYAIRRWGNVFYLSVAALALAEGSYLWHGGNRLAYPFLLMYLGTVAMHLLVENQNRYHFHALYMLAILAGFGVKEICESNRCRVQWRQEQSRREARLIVEERDRKVNLQREEEKLTQIREAAMQVRFDMLDALEKGYVTVRVSEAYAKEVQQNGKKAVKDSGSEEE